MADWTESQGVHRDIGHPPVPALSSPQSPAWGQLSLLEDTGRESLHLPVVGLKLVTSESLPASGL